MKKGYCFKGAVGKIREKRPQQRAREQHFETKTTKKQSPLPTFLCPPLRSVEFHTPVINRHVEFHMDRANPLLLLMPLD